MISALLNDRYRLEAELGRGGMGVVYRAHDLVLDRPVAVKVVTKGAIGSEGQLRLMREARAAAGLNHPHIVAVHDAGVSQGSNVHDTDEVSFIVMELVAGRSLRSYQPASVSQDIDIIQQLCLALAHAHEKGIIHRDIKPENVLIDDDGTAKLVDFGLARATGRTRLTQEGTLMGTLAYMAPEIILGQLATAQSDLYALGVMAYELLAGRQPFEGETPTAVLSQHLYAPVVPPSTHNDQVPPAVDQVVVALLNKEPADRPESAKVVYDRLVAWQAAGSSPVLPETALEQLDRLVRGRLIGREQEVNEILNLWQRVTTGESQLVFIGGEPGIGKTRLAREITAVAEISQATVLEANCYRGDQTPYGPFGQVIQSGFNRDIKSKLPESALAGLATISPTMQLEYPEIAPQEPVDPEQEQRELLNSILLFFHVLSAERPLLLVIDDIHRADSGSLAVLAHLARHLRRRPVMVVATYREVDIPGRQVFHQLHEDLVRQRLVTTVQLSRLNRSQTEQMLRTMFAEEVTGDFAEGIFRETEGNPFFIEEVCKALVDSGELYFEDGRWHRPDMADMGIPRSVRLAIRSRLDRLEPEEQSVLQVAAVIGREFGYDMLVAGVSNGQDQERLAEILSRAQRAQLVNEVRAVGRRVSGEQLLFSFTHSLIRETLLEEMTTLQRRELYRRTGLALEEAYPGQPAALAPLLARLFAEGHEPARAARYLLASGDNARQVYAYGEAIDRYSQAVTYLKEQKDYERAAETFMKLGSTYHSALDFASARRAYEEGFLMRQLATRRESASRSLARHALRINFFEPATLDPSRARDAFSSTHIDQLFSGLVATSTEGEIIPDIAHSWEILDSGRRYRFYLRDDARWSDGQPVTAGDFVCAWLRILDPATGSNPANLLYDIKGARVYNQGIEGAGQPGLQAVDDSTLEVVMEQPAGHFLHILTHSVCFPVPRHVVAEKGEAWSHPNHLVTNGPFRLARWEKGQYMELARSQDYPGPFDGNLEKVTVFYTTGSDDAQWQQYLADELDCLYLNFAPREVFDRVRLMRAGEYVSLPSPATSYVGFNTQLEPFDDVRVRRAFALATDREFLADSVLKGLYFPATGGFVPPGLPGHRASMEHRTALDEARALLAEAGYPGGQGLPAIRILAPEGMLAQTYLKALVAHWRDRLGLISGVEIVDMGRFLERQRQSPAQAWFIAWVADYPDPDSFLRTSHWPEYGGWRNDQYNYVIRQATLATDHRTRLEWYARAEEILAGEAPVIPLLYHRFHLVLKPWVRFPVSSWAITTWKNIVIESHE